MTPLLFEQLGKIIQKSITLSPEQLQAITHYFIPKKLRKRQYMQNAGRVSKYMVFVEKGLLRSFSVDETGHERRAPVVEVGDVAEPLDAHDEHAPDRQSGQHVGRRRRTPQQHPDHRTDDLHGGGAIDPGVSLAKSL